MLTFCAKGIEFDHRDFERMKSMDNKSFPDAVIFDMDGTLWDSAAAVAESWTRTASRFKGCERVFTTEDIHAVMGMTMDSISHLLFGHLPDSERIAVTEACFSEECEYVAKHGGILFPRLEETLKALCKVAKLYIVSNCQDGYIEAFFAYHGLNEYFCDYEDYGRTLLPKDGSLKMLIERNNIKNPVYIGDTQGDYEACRKANVDFIHAAYGFGKVEDVPKIDSIDELPSLLNEIYG